MGELEKRFQEASAELNRLINKRKSSWKLTSVMEWEDVSSVILAYIWKNFARYDSARPLDRWANTIITSQMRNLLRDKLLKHARPCLAATSYGNPCVYARGCDGCAWTKSGKQDSSCRFYAAWEKKKQAKFAVSTPLSMENHIDETHSIQSDFVDIEGAKKVIDEKIVGRLNSEEAKIYRLLYIEHLSTEEVGRRMGFKKQANSQVRGYLIIRNLQVKAKELAKVIIDEQDLA